MSALLAAPMLLTLLSASSAPAQPLSEQWDTAGARHLELTAENADEQHPVRISPHHPTNLVFNAPLQPDGVEVEDERLVAVAANAALGMVTLLPSDTLPPNKPLTVTVRFADGMVPESVTFRLVVHSTRAEHHVRVYRQPRSCESHHLEARQQRERAERCEATLEQERTGPEGQRPGSLSDLFDTGLVGEGSGVVGRKIILGKELTQRPGEPLKVVAAYSYHAERQGQVAVELKVENTDTRSWTAQGVEGATLVSAEGERLRVVRVMQPKSIAPGEQRQFVVVAEATVKQARGTFLLKLGEAGGPRTITVRGVMFL